MTRSLIFFFAGAIVTARGDVTIATPFRDGVVLQRGKPVAVWGTADAHEAVRVELHGRAARSAETIADADGKWRVDLAALEASAQPAALVVRGKNTLTVHDVLVGDVWLCSGQSNMFFYVRQAMNAEKEIAAANHPLIRQFLVKSVVSDRPLEMIDGEWQICSPQTVKTFTAVGYFFARDLQKAIGVPIGIIRATLGGSPIEGWMSASALARDPAFSIVAERWEAMRPKVKGDGIRAQPSGLYNGLIAPLEPYGLTGFLWYQGEGNHEHPREYGLLFRTMITQWRRDFGQGDLPFLFVQLPNYAEPGDTSNELWAWLRESQASALSLPNTGMAVTIDIGHPAQHHPTNKQEVGRRLALIAQRQVYGRAVADSGPTFDRIEKQGGALRVYFKKAEGLHGVGDLRHMFLLAGPDRTFAPAQCRVDGNTVVISSPAVANPVAVRFEWTNVPDGYLMNSEGLPAAPFRTDRW